jgi:hypothetical protein
VIACGCLVGGLAFAFAAAGGRAGVAAQKGANEPTVTRMFTGQDGLSHLEAMNMPAAEIKVAAVRFSRSSAARPNARTLEFHNAPHNRWVITLSGAAEIVVSGDNNKKFIADRDHILLAADTTGKGHTTRPVGPEDWVALFVEVDPTQQSATSR